MSIAARIIPTIGTLVTIVGLSISLPRKENILDNNNLDKDLVIGTLEVNPKVVKDLK
jgi:hypothetical protein